MKNNTIYFQFIRLVIVAAFISAGLFFVQHECYTNLISHFFYNQEYEDRMDEKYIRSLQNFIDEEQLSSRDCLQINRWAKNQQVVTVRIYQNNKLIYNSDYPAQDFWSEEVESPEYSWETYYDINFSDGKARVGLISWYEYQLYNYALIIEIIISFLVFIGIVLRGIRQKITYIRVLSRDVEILKQGDLSHSISIEGTDELSALALELNNMRVSILKMIEQEAETVKENQRTITEMSHDLRTPVTSILLFLEILRKEQYANPVHIREYLDKIEQKTVRMKQLTDHLLKYSLISKPEECTYETLSLKEAFYDLMSELCIYLEQNGIDIDLNIEWELSTIRVNVEFISRIIDNIASNLVKYADRGKPLKIVSLVDKDRAGFVFCNGIAEEEWRGDSNGVGVQSIQKMMRIMGGDCRIICENGNYCMELLFPIEHV